jgi:glutamine synthetase
VTVDSSRAEPLIFVGACDFAGLVRGKAFPATDLAERERSGVGYTGSNIMLSAFGPIYATPFGTFGDLKLVPDLTTRTRIGAGGFADADTPADGAVGAASAELALGDLRNLDDTPWSCCPRAFLRRGLDALAAEFDLTLLAAFEHEFVYTGVVDRAGSSYSFDMYRRSGSLGPHILAQLRAARIVPDSFLPEYARRQFEVTVKPRIGVRAADDAVLVREVVRACAEHDGERAIFAPLMDPDGVGNGTHIHFSLLDGQGAPAMYDANGALGVSARAAPFLAGIVEHMPVLTALTTPSVPSFYRLRPNKWAPVWANIGERDRGAALRICPIFNRDRAAAPAAFNVEYRICDGTANPYLALGAIVHAGLDGLRRNLAFPDHPQGPDADYAAARISALPRSLIRAVDLLAESAAAASWFGPEFLAAYVMFKRSENGAVEALNEDDVCRRYVEVY